MRYFIRLKTFRSSSGPSLEMSNVNVFMRPVGKTTTGKPPPLPPPPPHGAMRLVYMLDETKYYFPPELLMPLPIVSQNLNVAVWPEVRKGITSVLTVSFQLEMWELNWRVYVFAERNLILRSSQLAHFSSHIPCPLIHNPGTRRNRSIVSCTFMRVIWLPAYYEHRGFKGTSNNLT